ncbi:MAG: hypothetical protein M1825_002449 [Sarcosagium campestre]|nr:MAG: hypothetical protein M1825_002449 [Sarcosagium campestre]
MTMPLAKSRETFPRRSLGSLHARIREARILMVGAGGIGCELLKNLVLTGFGERWQVDSHRECSGDMETWAEAFILQVAKDTAGKFNPAVKLEAHHANIKDANFNIAWFKSFHLVFNALDNLDARRHVNKMCLAADVPLIESGTTGFNGQVQVIRKGKTECYDCNMKESPKSFPICTIRSTPSQPIHCIVWAKSYLFTEIFGTSEDDASDLDHSEDSENVQELKNLREEAQALKRIRDSMGSEDFTRRVFEKVFDEDIERLRSMEDMWKSRRPPESLKFDKVLEESRNLDRSTIASDQSTWSLAENFVVFSHSLARLSKRLVDEQSKGSNGDGASVLAFDKDDEDALDFVASSANLRSIIFRIDLKSKFDVKQMAGNIIPAIATTNAMVAGLCVLQAFKVLRDRLTDARMIFLAKSHERAITTEQLHPPRPDCPVCSVAQSRLEVDTSRATLGDLVEDLLRLKLGYSDEFSVTSEAGTLYDPELEDNLPRKFVDLGITGDSFLTIIDEDDDNPRVNLVLSIVETSLPEVSKPIVVPESLVVARKPKPADNSAAAATAAAAAAPADHTGHSNGMTTRTTTGNGEPGINGVQALGKRTADEADLDDVDLQRKREKLAQARQSPSSAATASTEEKQVVLDDSDSGAIVLD